MRNLGRLLAVGTLIASAPAAAAVPLRVDVNQLMNDEVAFHGVTVTTASSNVKMGKWSISLSQSFLQDNVVGMGRDPQGLLLRDVRQKARRGFRDLTLSAGRSYSLAKRLRLDLTMGSTVPMHGPFGTNRLDESADVMLESDRGPTSLWAGVTQHLRMGGSQQMRKHLTEFYAGVSHDVSDLTSVRATYYRAQSDERNLRPTTAMSLSVNHELRDLGNVGVSASRSKDWSSDDKRASLSLEVDKLPF